MLARRGYLGLPTNHHVPDRAERVQGAGQKRFPSADASGRSLADVPTGQRCHDNAYDARDYENEPLVPRSHVLLFPGHDQDLPVTRSTTSSDGTRTMRTRMKPSRFDHRAAPRAPVVHVDISREAAVNLNIHVLENTAAGTTRRPGDAWPSSLPRVCRLCRDRLAGRVHTPKDVTNARTGKHWARPPRNGRHRIWTDRDSRDRLADRAHRLLRSASLGSSFDQSVTRTPRPVLVYMGAYRH
jgi:hypothetical protein